MTKTFVSIHPDKEGETKLAPTKAETASNIKGRDYSLTGLEGKLAEAKGLTSASWYICPIPRTRLKQIMKRKDGPAVRDTILWFALLIGTGILAYHLWGSWWAVPVFLVYGILYAVPGNSRWHECGHGTAFKTDYMNEIVYQIASFMTLFPATHRRWSHTRHHTDTIIVGRDPEIGIERPPVWRVLLMEVFALFGGIKDFKRVIFLHPFGKLDKEEKTFIPASEHKKVFWEARAWVLIFITVIVLCIYSQSILPAMFVVLPTFYGGTVNFTNSLIQHAGLYENVLDHRLNTRTVYMNPVYRFLYWNMNYHIEHHMYPMVPYHALPLLHEEMKYDCPPACPSTWAALKEVIISFIKQRKDPTHTILRPLPDTAHPYQFGEHSVGTPPEEAIKILEKLKENI